jgi:hypothetical protein
LQANRAPKRIHANSLQEAPIAVLSLFKGLAAGKGEMRVIGDAKICVFCVSYVLLLEALGSRSASPTVFLICTLIFDDLRENAAENFAGDAAFPRRAIARSIGRAPPPPQESATASSSERRALIAASGNRELAKSEQARNRAFIRANRAF